MEDKIKVYDNFLETNTLNWINKQLNRPKWSFTGGGISDEVASKFWHMDGLETEDSFVEIYKQNIEQLNPKNTKIKRIYANGQTATQSGVPHMDDGDTTILFFPTYWKHYWGGHLHFWDKGNLTKVVEYKQNRLVTFPAGITHYAGAPDKSFIGLRVSLAFKVDNV